MIVNAQGLDFAYGSVPVLTGVDIEIEPGITAIIGPNAVGKSTLLKCLCGLLKPDGQVCIDGRDLRDFKSEELTRQVSYLPQDLSTNAVLTVFEIVLLGRVYQLGLRVSPEDVCRVERLLDEFSLTALSDRYVTELSGGQFQLVAIAQALAREPAVLLMDEPTSSLDLRRQFEICTLIRELTISRGISTALAIHDLNVAARFADTICVLQNGRIRCFGTPSEVLTEEMIASVYRMAARVTSDEHGKPVVTVLGLPRPKETIVENFILVGEKP